jgi:hypothetical protein
MAKIASYKKKKARDAFAFMGVISFWSRPAWGRGTLSEGGATRIQIIVTHAKEANRAA